MRDETRPCLSFELVKLAIIHGRVRAVVPVSRITFSFQSNLFARESPSLLQTRRKRSNWKKNFSAIPDDVLHARWVPAKTIFHWVFLLFYVTSLFNNETVRRPGVTMNIEKHSTRMRKMHNMTCRTCSVLTTKAISLCYHANHSLPWYGETTAWCKSTSPVWK